MPVYDYECLECGNTMEKIHSIDEKIDMLFCQQCNKSVKVKKIITKMNFKLEGDGWSRDGYSKVKDAL